MKYITTSAATQTSAVGNIVAVCQNGDVFSLNGETLAVQWTSSSKSAVQDVSSSTVDKFEIDFITSGTMEDLSEGMFKHRPEVYTALPKGSTVDPTLLVLVSRSVNQGETDRHLLVLAAGSGDSAAETQRLTPLDVAPLPSTTTRSSKYRFEAQSGLLLQLHEGALEVYDLTGAVPKVKSIIQMEDATTFAIMSRPFILSCSPGSISLYNYRYRSVHANTPLDLSELPSENRSPDSMELITYLRSQDVMVALVDNVLVCIQIEPPKSNGKRRKAGLLIDSIGRGTAVEIPSKRQRMEHPMDDFSNRIPGTMTPEYLANFQARTEAADELLGQNDIAGWEKILRVEFGMETEPATASKGQASEPDELPEWVWPEEPTPYPPVDRRWVIYAINRVFAAEVANPEEPTLRLRSLLPGTNVFQYLAMAGHLTLSNLQSAFREEIEDSTGQRNFAADLVSALVEADESMALLLNYLQATKLAEAEVLLAIRALMVSMDLIPTVGKTNTAKLLANEASEAGKDDMDLDDLERELAVTEHYLGDESSSRSRGLTLAFTKLWRLPSRGVVKALRSTLQTEEILSLIHLLRIELVQGAWTSLYIDPTSFDAEGNEPPPDSVIALISDLLGRCIDAVGAGGWLLNDAVSSMDEAASETGDFITALKLEVTAALEGIEEAVYLNGVVGESARYGLAASKGGAQRLAGWNVNKPLPVAVESRESRMLPLGLRTKGLPSRDKVVSGGEVVQRSLRETGHLISQKVEAYSLEKLAV